MPQWPPPYSASHCREEQARLNRVSAPFGSVAKWREAVFDQRVRLFLELEQQVIQAPPSAPLSTFDAFPARPPCGGVSLGEAEWAQSPLGKLGIARIAPLYFSVAVQERREKSTPDAPFVTFTMYQDLDCDGVVGVTISEGWIRRGSRDWWKQQTLWKSPEFMAE